MKIDDRISEKKILVLNATLMSTLNADGEKVEINYKLKANFLDMTCNVIEIVSRSLHVISLRLSFLCSTHAHFTSIRKLCQLNIVTSLLLQTLRNEFTFPLVLLCLRCYQSQTT